MNTDIRQLIDLKKVDTLLEGFNKSTGFVSAIIDLEGNVLSKSGWRSICTEFHRINPETTKRCIFSDTVLANNMEKSEKYHAYQCLNGLMDVAVPLKIQGEHVANLFSGQFLFEEPDVEFFRKQAAAFGFDEKKYLDALSKVPVVSEEMVKAAMDFLLNMTEFISDLTIQKMKQAELNQNLRDNEQKLEASNQQLEASEQQLRNVLENTGSVFYSHTTDHKITFFSPQIEEILGYTPEEVMIKWTELVSDNPINEIGFNHTVKAIETGKRQPVYELELVRKDGKKVFVEVNESPVVKNGKTVAISGSLTDITERKHAEEELEKSEEKYRLLFANNPQPMWIFDLETLAFLEVNEAAINHYGYSKEEFLSMTLIDIRPVENIPALLEELKKAHTGLNTAGEWRHLKKNGEIIVVEITSHSLSFNDRKARHILINDITARKRAEIEISKLSRAVEQSTASIIITDLDGKIEYINPKTLEITGYTKEELIGKNPRIFNSGEKPKEDYQQLWSALLSGREWTGEFHNKKKNGELYWESASISPIINEKQEITNYLAIKEDITERKKFIEDLKFAKEKAEENEDKLTTLIGNLPGLVYSSNSKWETDFINGSLNISGYSEDDFLTKRINWMDLIHEDDRQMVFEQGAILLKKKTSIIQEYRIVAKANRVIHVSDYKTSVFSIDNKFVGVEGVVFDITEKNKQKEELVLSKEKAEESEQRFKSIIENAPDGVVILNERGKFKYVSPNAARLFGYSVNEVIGHFGDEFTHPDDVPLVLKTIETIFNNPLQTPIVSYRFRRKNGEYRWIETTFTNLLSDKAINGIILNFTDVTERRQILEDLVTAKEKAEESDRLKSAFLANMSHEIRTPMNGILGFTELLLEPDLGSEEQEAYIKIVHQSGQRMLNTVNDIIEISKIEAGIVTVDLKEVDVQERLDELIRFFTPESTKKGLNLILEKETPKTAATNLTDQNKLDSILTNLIKNAIKFTPSGEIRVGCEVKANNLEFYVKDTGIGIPAERQQAIFDRFIQADIEDAHAFQGSGLGLSIAKAYVEMLGGKIWVKSEPGTGSTFYFTLPLEASKQKKTATEGIETKIPFAKSGAKPKVLIAEDDSVSFQHLSILLKKYTREILHATNGEQAVEICNEQPDIDIILMDIRMPLLDGFDATRRIRKFNKEVAIIAQTAYALSGDSEKALKAGCNDYISKPINKKVLLNKIGKLKLNIFTE